MAKQGMGKSMGNRECEWIRPRLPLWVDTADGERAASLGQTADLSARELGHIDRHLAMCNPCRVYRDSLDQALGALAIAATQLPMNAQAPSLWPILERRIADRGASSRRPTEARALGDRSVRDWSDLDGERSLRQAWTHDTIRAALASRHLQKSDQKRMSRLLMKLAVAAAIGFGLFELSVVNRQWQSARSVIIANSLPLANPVVAPAAATDAPLASAESDTGNVAVTQVAEIESTRPVEVSAPGLETTLSAPKSAPPTRFGFDLEHGTPMPTDSRDAKPVY